MEERVNQLLADKFALRRLSTDEILELINLRDIYRVLSCDEGGPVDLPADVAAEVAGGPPGHRWFIHGRGRGHNGVIYGVLKGEVGLHCASNSLGSGASVPTARVRAATDAVTTRILNSKQEKSSERAIDGL